MSRDVLTENVEKAWCVWVHEPPGRYDRDEPAEQNLIDEINTDIEGVCPHGLTYPRGISLAEAMGLLAWAATQSHPPLDVSMGTFLDGSEFCTRIQLFSTYEVNPNEWTADEQVWVNPCEQAIGAKMLLEHVLMAVDFIVEEHPEAFE